MAAWAVAFAFGVVMMLATLPSPLYDLYRTLSAAFEQAEEPPVAPSAPAHP